jgi:glycosyltransferase involved in cell wall biosynthesis
MKILQFCPTLSYGDAIGDEVLFMKKILLSLGYETEIYCEFVHHPYTRKDAKNIDNISIVSKNDVAILHLSTGSRLNELFGDMSCRKIIRYHNITPPDFFENYNPSYSGINKWALQSARKLAKVTDYCLGDSSFNKSDLLNMGYNCKIDVMPLLIDFDKYKDNPDKFVLSQYADKYTNILFTGRIVPNKKIENLIKVFSLYQKHFNRKSRLFLVGSYNKNDTYYIKLEKYIDLIEVNNVLFTGHIKIEDVLAYYHLADIFLCMSEHEGFCVPLVEAMFFDVPIIAYDKCAVKETLGGAGFLISEKDPLAFAKAIDYVLRNIKIREKIIAAQKSKLHDFDTKKTINQFSALLDEFVKNSHFNE